VPGKAEVVAVLQKEHQDAMAREARKAAEATRQRDQAAATFAGARQSEPPPVQPPPYAPQPAPHPHPHQPGTGLFFPQIVTSAKWVRTGASFIAAVGYVSLVVGVVALVIGLIVFSQANSGGDRATATLSIGYGIGATIWGIIVVAVAEFFRMISFTCEAVRVAGESVVRSGTARG
jgi:hypothetical protein